MGMAAIPRGLCRGIPRSPRETLVHDILSMTAKMPFEGTELITIGGKFECGPCGVLNLEWYLSICDKMQACAFRLMCLQEIQISTKSVGRLHTC